MIIMNIPQMVSSLIQRLLRKLSKMKYTIWKLLKWYDQQWTLCLKNKWSDLSPPNPKGSYEQPWRLCKKNAKNWHTRCARWWNDFNIEHTLNTLWWHSDDTLMTLWKWASWKFSMYAWGEKVKVLVFESVCMCKGKTNTW